METRYLKLNNSDIISYRKELLFSEINFLNLIKKIHNYSLLKKGKLDKLKSEIANLRSQLDSLTNIFPKEEIKLVKEKHKPKKVEKRKTIDDELEEIKEKLARLSRIS